MGYTLRVPRTGRPHKAEEEKYVGRLIKALPSLWARLDELVGEGQRAQFVREALEAALRREERRRAKQGEPDELEERA